MRSEDVVVVVSQLVWRGGGRREEGRVCVPHWPCSSPSGTLTPSVSPLLIFTSFIVAASRCDPPGLHSSLN